MKIVTLTPAQFDNYSSNHPLHTYYQTSAYGNVMAGEGFEPCYYGFINDQNVLMGASLVLIQKLLLGYKYAYAPRGFLIDYDNKDLIVDITNKMNRFFAKNNIVFLKIDPPVVNNKRDKDGNILKSPYTNDLIPFLTKVGYIHYDDDNYFNTLKPRWNAILKVTGSSKTLFDNLDSSVKNKIRKAQSRGVEILQGNHNDLEIFYKFVAKKHYRKLAYYESFAKNFGNNLELYFAKLDTNKYLNNIKLIYEEELSKNEQLNHEIQSAGVSHKISNKLTNSKITSDKMLAVYKKELENASELFAKSPQGLIIGSTAVIIEKHGVELLIEGLNPAFKLFYPTFLTKWFIIEKYSKLGAVYFDLNAIVGYFGNNNKFQGLNEMKLGYNADVTEYVGEFDLIINKTIYSLYKKGFGKKKIKKDHVPNKKTKKAE